MPRAESQRLEALGGRDPLAGWGETHPLPARLSPGLCSWFFPSELPCYLLDDNGKSPSLGLSFLTCEMVGGGA